MSTKARADPRGGGPRGEILVYGAGGMGREVSWLATDCGYAVRCYVDDRAKPGQQVAGLPVLDVQTARSMFGDAVIALGIGSSGGREQATAAARAAGFEIATLVHPSVLHSARVQIGEGSVICAGTILTTDVVIGDNVQVNLHCTVSHDVILEAFCTLAPGVQLSGSVRVGRRVHLGAGAIVINGTPGDPITIGEDATVGAGACVTRSIPPGTTVAGVPARPLER